MKMSVASTFLATCLQVVSSRQLFHAPGGMPPASVRLAYCSPEARSQLNGQMLLYSNIGGMGSSDLHTPHGMYFTDVAPDIDLAITATSSYYPGDAPNIVNGDIARLGLASGSFTKLNFAFRVDDEAPGVMSMFVFTIMDAKGVNTPSKTVEVCGYQSFVLSTGSIVSAVETISGDLKCVHLVWPVSLNSTAMPKHIRNLDTEALRGSVSFLFYSVSEFEVKFSVDSATHDQAASGYFWWGVESNLLCPTRAPCSEYTCPKFFGLLPDASALYCDSDTCGDTDRNTCCELQQPDECSEDTTMLFATGALLHNNLGGHGPDSGNPIGMYYQDIFPGSRQRLDLLVTAEGDYAPHNTERNGQHGRFGSVNVMTGTSATLLFQFMSEGRVTKTEFPFFFSIMDFDHGITGKESIYIENVTEYELSDNTTISVTVMPLASGGNVTTFSATVRGQYDDNPWNPANLTPSQVDKTVTLQYPMSSEFRITFEAGGDTVRPNSGRNFIFAGWTTTSCSDNTLCAEYACSAGKELRPMNDIIQCVGDTCTEVSDERCCVEKAPPVCHWNNALMFSSGSLFINDLDGHGPMFDSLPIMFFGDVQPGSRKSGSMVDMIVNVRDSYSPGNVSFNHAESGIITFSLTAGSRLFLRLRFIDRLQQRFTTLNNFSLSLLDIGSDGPGSATESVTVHGASSYAIPDDTTLSVTMKDGAVTFTGQEQNAAEPINPLRLDEAQRLRSASVIFDSASFVDIDLMTTPTKDGSEQEVKMYLVGRSNAQCPPPAECGSYHCPADTTIVHEASSVFCRGEECTQEECCIPSLVAECVVEKTLSFNDANVIRSNLGGLGPDEGEAEELVFSDVFPSSGQDMMLKVTAVSEYSGEFYRNALVGLAGGISIDQGTSTTFTFEVRRRNHSDGDAGDIVLPFWLTFQDILSLGQMPSHFETSPLRQRRLLRKEGAKEGTLDSEEEQRLTRQERRQQVLNCTEGESFAEKRMCSRTLRRLLRKQVEADALEKMKNRNRFAKHLARRAASKAMKGGRMWLSTADAVDYLVWHPTSVAVTSANGRLSFYSGTHASSDADILSAPHPMTMTPLQKSAAVALKFDRLRFNITLGVESTSRDRSGTFKFSGATNMLCADRAPCSSFECPAPHYQARARVQQTLCMGPVCTALDRDACCEPAVCDSSRELKLRPGSLKVSNLAGLGPDLGEEEALIFEDVFPLANQTLNLVVKSTTDDYHPYNSSKNGLNGASGSINLLAGSTAHLNFSFVDNETGELVQVEPFAFSMLDIDQQRENGQESVSISNYTFLATTEHSDVDITADNVEVSTAYGSFPDNPTNLRNLTHEQLARAVTYSMNSVSTFQVTLNVGMGFAGRNFAFGGATNLVCPGREMCATFMCPNGYSPRPENRYHHCAGEHCRNTVDDVSTCCKADGGTSALWVFKDERRANGLDRAPLPKYVSHFPTAEMQAAWKTTR